MHHDANYLNILVRYRMHPVDLMIDGVGAAVVNLLSLILFRFFVSVEGGVYAVYPALAIAVLVGPFVYLQHTQIWVNFGVFNHVIMSPVMHHVHHSTKREHLDRNFGFIFPFWDAIFGTLYSPGKKEKMHIGPRELKRAKPDPILKQLFWPFFESTRLVGGDALAYLRLRFPGRNRGQ